ncbi:MAG: amino acid ABC transporter permease [Desulfatibacillum sp.]|nr:amino acid ABC transporter permease [Desulfatibacillum sp.]
MDWAVITDNMGYMLGGLGLTFQMTLIALSGGMFLGCFLAMGRLSSKKWVYYPASAYVHFFRSQPLILVIFWLYFLAPVFVGRPLGAFYSTMIAFVFFEASYFSEIIRGGIQSVPKGQVMAAQATGLGFFTIQRYVVLPQALGNMAPALITRAIVIFQDTSLAYVVGLREFLRRVNLVDTREVRSVELYCFAAVVYFVICTLGSLFADHLERKREASKA